MSTKRVTVVVLGLVLIAASAVGHVWHKYLTAAGASRSEAFRDYALHHWYFWLGLLLGAVLIWVGSRRHPSVSLD